jgi:hypothetical protein
MGWRTSWRCVDEGAVALWVSREAWLAAEIEVQGERLEKAMLVCGRVEPAGRTHPTPRQAKE